MIEQLQNSEDSKTGEVMFHSLATITSLDGMLSHADVKYLKEKLDDAFSAALSTAGITGTWTISLEVEVRAVAGAPTISSGVVPSVTE